MRLATKSQQFLQLLARVLPPDERTVVLGDLHEDSAGLLFSMTAIVGYAVRRELSLWEGPLPWLALLAVVVPCVAMLGSVSLSMADGNAIYVWIFANNWDAYLLRQPGFWNGLGEYLPSMVLSALALICWSWCCGSVIGLVTQKTLRTNCLLLCFFFLTLWLGWRPPTSDLQALTLARDFPGNAGVFRNLFYRRIFAPFVQMVFVVVPLLAGIRDQHSCPVRSPRASRVYWVLVGVSIASLVAGASLWWQARTWTTVPALKPHLPPVTPLALAGLLAFILKRSRWRSTSDSGDPLPYALRQLPDPND